MITVLSTFSTYCQVRTPEFKNGLVDRFVYQWGYIDIETWHFKGDSHDINFHTEEMFLKALVKWL